MDSTCWCGAAEYPTALGGVILFRRRLTSRRAGMALTKRRLMTAPQGETKPTGPDFYAPART